MVWKIDFCTVICSAFLKIAICTVRKIHFGCFLRVSRQYENENSFLYSQLGHFDCTELEIFTCTGENDCTEKRIEILTVTPRRIAERYGITTVQNPRSSSVLQQMTVHTENPYPYDNSDYHYFDHKNTRGKTPGVFLLFSRFSSGPV